MVTSHPVQRRSRMTQGMLILLLFSLLLLTSACSGDARMRQNAVNSQAHLDQLLKHAQEIGVPASFLQPVLQQQQRLSVDAAPFDLFSNQPADAYYSRLDTQYVRLAERVPGIIATATSQTRTQAQQNLKSAQASVSQEATFGLPTGALAQPLQQTEKMLARAQLPADYVQVSNQSQVIGQTINQLVTFKNTLGLLQDAHIAVSGSDTSYRQDVQASTHVTTGEDARQLNARVTTHTQQALEILLHNAPSVTTARLNMLSEQIQQLPAEGVNPAPYQQLLAQDRALVGPDMNLQRLQMFTNRIDADITTVQAKLVRSEAPALLQRFHNEANSWGNAHLYHDTFDGQSYMLDAGYLSQGIGSDLDNELAQASSLQDYQNVVNDTNNALFDLSMMEADYQDTTPYNQVHATDLKMLDRYQLNSGQVIVVSLAQQAMRIYQNGKLEQAFQVTTGRPELPSLPGLWSVQARLSPTVFKSPDPPGSPYWYPDTNINYAIMYHAGGYFIHDSWWRDNYGPGTQFPHADASGDQSFAGDGSHGCINMQEDQAAWVYSHTGWNTSILIY